MYNVREKLRLDKPHERGEEKFTSNIEKERLGNVRFRDQYNGKRLGLGNGEAMDMFMVQRRLRNGQRFGFVRFKLVRDVDGLLRKLQNIRIEDECLKVFVVYDRRNNGNIGTNRGDSR
ncbi:hypothetical protein Tco_1548167 [Tanacetum coccineum]